MESMNEAQSFAEEWGGWWSSHDEYLPEQWQKEVADGNTRAGYWDWVIAQLELEQ